jgi:hypothetical protein
MDKTSERTSAFLAKQGMKAEVAFGESATSGRLRIERAARVVALAGVLSLTGCISTKSGSGPLASEQAVQAYGQQMGVLQAEERARFERVAAKLPATPAKPLPYLRFCLGGAPKLGG